MPPNRLLNRLWPLPHIIDFVVNDVLNITEREKKIKQNRFQWNLYNFWFFLVFYFKIITDHWLFILFSAELPAPSVGYNFCFFGILFQNHNWSLTFHFVFGWASAPSVGLEKVRGGGQTRWFYVIHWTEFDRPDSDKE